MPNSQPEIALPARALLMVWLSCLCAAPMGAAARPSGPGPQTQADGARRQAGALLSRTALPLALVGVMVDSTDPSRSACLIRCTYPNARRSASDLEVGGDACGLAEIKEIREDAVVVRNLLTNQLEVLPLQPSGVSSMATPAATTPPAPAVVQAAPDLVSVDLPKASVAHYLLNLTDLLSSARATPRFQDSGNGQFAMAGFELDQVKPGSVVEQLGLKNGDVIVEVNGEKLDSMATVMRLFGRAQAMPQSTLTVLRSGKRMTFAFNTR